MLRYWKVYNPAKSFLFGALASSTLFIVGRNFKDQDVFLTFLSVFLMFLGLHAMNWLFEIDFNGNGKGMKKFVKKLATEKELLFATILPTVASFAIAANYLAPESSLVIFADLVAVALYGLFRYKYPLIAITKAYLAASAILFATFVVGINRLFVVPTILCFCIIFVHEVVKNISVGPAKNYKRSTFTALYGERIAGMIAAGTILGIVAIGFIPAVYYPYRYVFLTGLSDIFFVYVAYRMIIDPKKYAKESRWFIIAGGLLMALSFIVGTYF